MTGIVGIVGRGSVWLAGDRAGVEDGHYFTTVTQPKVFRNGDLVIGYTSSFRMGQLLQHRFTPPALPNDPAQLDRYMATEFADAVRATLRDGGWLKRECEREAGGTYLVGTMGRLFTADGDFNFHEREDGFDACGSGVSVALGALYATRDAEADPAERAVLALSAASRFTATVRGPFDVICLPANADECGRRAA